MRKGPKKTKEEGAEEDDGKSGMAMQCDGCFCFFGPVVFILGCYLLFWNEGKHAEFKTAIEEVRTNTILHADCTTADANNDKQLVWTSCALKTPTLTDSSFNFVTADSFSLTRSVQGWVWIETATGVRCSEEEEGQSGCKCTRPEGERKKTNKNSKVCLKYEYSYNKGWAASPPASSAFKTQQAETNPGSFMVSGTTQWTANVESGDKFIVPLDMAKAKLTAQTEVKAVLVGATESCARRLRGGNARQLKGTNTSGVTQTAMGDTWTCAGALHTFAKEDASAQQIGDLKVTFSAASDTHVTMIGVQRKADDETKRTFKPYETMSGTVIHIVEPGTKTAAEIFAELDANNDISIFIFRIVGIIFIWMGAACFFQPFVDLVEMVPLIGNCLDNLGSMIACICSVFVAVPVVAGLIGVAWFLKQYQATMALPMIGAGGFGVLMTLLSACRMRGEHQKREKEIKKAAETSKAKKDGKGKEAPVAVEDEIFDG